MLRHLSDKEMKEKGCEVCEFKGECPVFIMASHKEVKKELAQIKEYLKGMCEAFRGKFKDPSVPPDITDLF